MAYRMTGVPIGLGLKFERLAAVIVVTGLSSFAAAAIEDKRRKAPETTAAEATLPFQDIPYREIAHMDASPADRKGGLSVGTLGIDSGRTDMVIAQAQEIVDGRRSQLDSLLIGHKGKLWFGSSYLHGRVDLPYP